MKELVSIDETKDSLLMKLLMTSFVVAMYQVIRYGDISGNLLQLLFMLIGAVSGINIAAKITTKNTQVKYGKDDSNDSKGV